MHIFSAVIGSWASLYNDHKAVLAIVMFGHFGGLLVGGGAAVGFDLATLRLRGASAAHRAAHLAHLPAVHRAVVLGLSVTIVSGILMTLADASTFLHSPAFWVKMLVLMLLAANGAMLTREKSQQVVADPVWARMTRSASFSLALWLAATLAGVVLATTA